MIADQISKMQIDRISLRFLFSFSRPSLPQIPLFTAASRIFEAAFSSFAYYPADLDRVRVLPGLATRRRSEKKGAFSMFSGTHGKNHTKPHIMDNGPSCMLYDLRRQTKDLQMI